MLFTYEIALRNEKGDVLRNFGGSFVTNGSSEYLLVSHLIDFASNLSERANKADDSTITQLQERDCDTCDCSHG